MESNKQEARGIAKNRNNQVENVLKLITSRLLSVDRLVPVCYGIKISKHFVQIIDTAQQVLKMDKTKYTYKLMLLNLTHMINLHLTPKNHKEAHNSKNIIQVLIKII